MKPILDIHSHFEKEVLTNTIYSFSTPNLPIDFGGYKSIGLHPWHINTSEESWTQIEKLAQEPLTLAIGECGIDKKITTSIDIQQQLFIKHIELSESTQKPLIIHMVGSTPEIIQLHKAINPKQNWIIHGFRGKPELYKEYQRQGIYVSIGEKYNNCTIQLIPNQELLIETDESSKSIEQIVSKIAILRKTTPQQLIDQIYKNTTRIFFD